MNATTTCSDNHPNSTNRHNSVNHPNTVNCQATPTQNDLRYQNALLELGSIISKARDLDMVERHSPKTGEDPANIKALVVRIWDDYDPDQCHKSGHYLYGITYTKENRKEWQATGWTSCVFVDDVETKIYLPEVVRAIGDAVCEKLKGKDITINII